VNPPNTDSGTHGSPKRQRLRYPGALVLLLGFAVGSPASARQPAEPPPVTIELTTASDSVVLPDPLSFVVTFRNRSAKPIALGPSYAIHRDLRRSLELTDRKGVVYRLYRFTKDGVPAPRARQMIVLEPGEVHAFSLLLPLAHDEQSDYHFVRDGRPGDTAPDRGVRTLKPGPYRIRAHYRYPATEDETERLVEVASQSVTVRFR